MKGIGVKGARQKNGLWSLGGFEGLACGAGLVNGEGLSGTGSLDRFVVGALRDRSGRGAPWDRLIVGLRGTGLREGSVGQVRGGAPRDQSCARRERWDRRSFRAAARRDQDVDVPTLAPARSRCRLVVRAGVAH